MTTLLLQMSLAFAISFLVTWFLIPRIISFAFKKQLFDCPDERKIHHGSVPRLGGVAFFPVTLFAITMVTVLSVLMWGEGDIDEITPLQHGGLNLTQHGVQLTFGLCAALILYVFGIADDLKGVRYRNKFIAQIVAGALLCMSGLWLKDLHGIVGLHAISPWIGWPLTIFAIVFITNAINFIDGIDGLASSLCSIALIYFAVGFCVIEHFDYALLAITVLGALLPFLWYNVHGRAERHNKIFMGDTGSLFLGFLLGALGVAFNNAMDLYSHMIIPDNSELTVELLRGPAVLVADNDPQSFELCTGSRLRVSISDERTSVYGLDVFRCMDCYDLRKKGIN